MTYAMFVAHLKELRERNVPDCLNVGVIFFEHNKVTGHLVRYYCNKEELWVEFDDGVYSFRCSNHSRGADLALSGHRVHAVSIREHLRHRERDVENLKRWLRHDAQVALWTAAGQAAIVRQ